MRVWDLILSHHYPEDYGNCYTVGGVRLCARCAGLYPALAAAMSASFALGAVAVLGPLDMPLLYAAPLPMIAHWAGAAAGLIKASNPARTALGALAGLGIGRAVFLNLRPETRGWALIQFAEIGAAAAAAVLLVLGWRFWKASRI